MIDGDSTVVYWDVQFGQDSIVFATFYGAKDQDPAGCGKIRFPRVGWCGRQETGRCRLDHHGGFGSWQYHGHSPRHGFTGRYDLLCFTIARRKAADANAPQKIYVVKNLYTGSPSLDTVYSDKQNNMTGSRSDIAVDAVGNIIYFENSNEEVVLVSPPTGPNSFMTRGLEAIKVIASESISAVRRQTVDPYRPDRLNDTVTVIGTVNSANPTASANRFQYFIKMIAPASVSPREVSRAADPSTRSAIES